MSRRENARGKQLHGTRALEADHREELRREAKRESAVLRYEIRIRWSDADECFIAWVPELEGCIAHGSTREEALLEIQIAMDGWVHMVRRLGRPIPEPKTSNELEWSEGPSSCIR